MRAFQNQHFRKDHHERNAHDTIRYSTELILAFNASGANRCWERAANK